METDWDLHAVVRGFSSSTTTTIANASAATLCGVSPSGSHFRGNEGGVPLVCQEPLLASRRNVFEELHQLYQPFVLNPEPFPWRSCSSSPSSLSSSLFERTKSSLSVVAHIQRPSAGFKATSRVSKSKKRKITQKKVCEVPAESVSSDEWAWRKYGQKPIKGSPFPRSYYRCSSSKGCLARKQVERNRSDPCMFIITYTAEHNHPAQAQQNSLAGVPCPKQVSQSSTTPSRDSNVQASTPCSSQNDSPEEEGTVLRGGESPDEDGIETEGVFQSDDFFGELEGFMDLDPLEACFRFQWTANNTAAAAAGKELS